MLWKDRLYQSYVSSGQAPAAENVVSPESFFRSRAPYFRHVIDRFIPRCRQIKIVDLGCGHGSSLHFLKCAGYRNIIGIDVSSEQIAQAHRLGITEAHQGRVDSFLNNFAPGTVDVVLLFDVLEHLTRDELFSTLDGVHRILREGGVCIVHVPNAEGIYGMRIRYGDLTHEQSFTSRSMQQVFATIGFASVECFEDKPKVHGILSGLRRAVWEAGTLPHRLLLAAETGQTQFILSQNMLAVARRSFSNGASIVDDALIRHVRECEELQSD